MGADISIQGPISDPNADGQELGTTACWPNRLALRGVETANFVDTVDQRACNYDNLDKSRSVL